MASNPSDANENSGAPEGLWSAAAACVTNTDRSAADLREAVGLAVSDLAGAGRELTVYVAKTTDKGYRNQVWQGLGNTQANDVMVLLHTEGNHAGVESEARSRLNPLAQNGFDAIVICEESDDDWTIRSVVEYDHSAVGNRLREMDNDVEVRRVRDPSINSSDQVEFATHPVGEPSDLTAEVAKSHLIEAKNLIFVGPPGTGKTRLAYKVAELLAEANLESGRLETVLAGRALEDVSLEDLQEPALVWDIVQMHPAYGYEEFVRGLRTDPDQKGFALRSVDGILPIMAKVAAARAGRPTLLIVDEINRANISNVLGETIFAIDPAHRGRPVRLQYDAADGGEDTLSVPANLYLVATMNTADRSIAMLDFALRRRFRFLPMGPSMAAIAAFYGAQQKHAAVSKALMEAINQVVADPDVQIGHSYFLVDPSLEDADWIAALSERLLYEVRPLLLEYRDEGRLPENARVMIGQVEVDFLEPSDAIFRGAVEEALSGFAAS